MVSGGSNVSRTLENWKYLGSFMENSETTDEKRVYLYFKCDEHYTTATGRIFVPPLVKISYIHSFYILAPASISVATLFAYSINFAYFANPANSTY